MKVEIHSLSSFTKGWFVGDFSPTLLRTTQFEVSAKTYAAGDQESRHVHKIAIEITVVLLGKILMNGQVVSSGNAVIMRPGESTDFSAIEDTIVVVIKVPSAIGDKYLA